MTKFRTEGERERRFHRGICAPIPLTSKPLEFRPLVYSTEMKEALAKARAWHALPSLVHD